MSSRSTLTFDLYRNKQFTIKTSNMLSTAPPVSQYWASCLNVTLRPCCDTARLKRLLPDVGEEKTTKKKPNEKKNYSSIQKAFYMLKTRSQTVQGLFCSASCQRQHCRFRYVRCQAGVSRWMQIKYSRKGKIKKPNDHDEKCPLKSPVLCLRHNVNNCCQPNWMWGVK